MVVLKCPRCKSSLVSIYNYRDSVDRTMFIDCECFSCMHEWTERRSEKEAKDLIFIYSDKEINLNNLKESKENKS